MIDYCRKCCLKQRAMGDGAWDWQGSRRGDGTDGLCQREDCAKKLCVFSMLDWVLQATADGLWRPN